MEPYAARNDSEITKLSWFQSDRYQARNSLDHRHDEDFFRFLDSVGGFWLYRWGDHAAATPIDL